MKQSILFFKWNTYNHATKVEEDADICSFENYTTQTQTQNTETFFLENYELRYDRAGLYICTLVS